MSELKPCPCCGSTDVGGAGGIVSCYSCHLETTKHKTTSDACQSWNNRPAENKIKADGVREAKAEALAKLGWRDTTHYLVVKFLRKLDEVTERIEKGD